MPIVLYGYEIGCLTLWKEYGLKVFKKRVLREIRAHIREDKLGLEKTYVEEVHDFYFH